MYWTEVNSDPSFMVEWVSYMSSSIMIMGGGGGLPLLILPLGKFGGVWYLAHTILVVI